MRKFLKPIESVPALEEISLEEVIALTGELSDHSNAIDQDLSEVARITDIAGALEELAAVTATIREASPTEIALINSAADMAVAGTDIQPEYVVPGLATEEHIGKSIAVESMMETIAVLWKKIKDFVTNIWMHIEMFVNKFMNIVPALRAMISMQRKKLKSYENSEIVEKVTKINRSAKMFSINNRVVKNADEMAAGLEAVKVSANMLFHGYHKYILALGDKITHAMGKYQPRKKNSTREEESRLDALNEPVVKELEEAIKKIVIPKDSKMTKMPDPSSKDFDLYISDVMFGGYTLNCRVERPFMKSIVTGKYTHTLGHLVDSGMFLTQYRFNGADEHNGFSIPTPKIGELSYILDMCDALLDEADGYRKSNSFKEIVNVRQKLSQASDALAAKAGDNADPYDYDLRNLLQTNSSFAKWAKNPIIDMLRYCSTVVINVVPVVSTCLGNYSKPEKAEVEAGPALQLNHG